MSTPETEKKKSFTISAPPETDVWRKPPSTNVFNAPTHPLIPSPIPLQSFQRARLTFSGPWTTRYDQGGLLLILTTTKATTTDSDAYWLKTGIEFYMSVPNLSTVATREWSDWSVFPLSEREVEGDGKGKVTVEARRESDELGTSLWVYQILPTAAAAAAGQRVPLREVTWFFADEEGGGWNLDIRAMAARPAKEGDVVGKKELVVEFEDVQIEVAEVV
ncbi:hypothetical protein E1B28_004035 [Marasmius oreades]|uniref:Uncharacterized protein n=1 Tax=Marasmius oreades TaxID=181124 RepID=A0A9P7UXZ1_9AGAR|nr:uncharacterized protein E1B28_004035 [Marasmius oreades]KAG7096618.1 hypothetical protein E1B28_004035 [Marasmius oreades]